MLVDLPRIIIVLALGISEVRVGHEDNFYFSKIKKYFFLSSMSDDARLSSSHELKNNFSFRKTKTSVGLMDVGGLHGSGYPPGSKNVKIPLWTRGGVTNTDETRHNCYCLVHPPPPPGGVRVY